MKDKGGCIFYEAFCFLIYNPHAGKELFKTESLADVIDIFVKAGYEVVAYPTQAYRDAYKKT